MSFSDEILSLTLDDMRASAPRIANDAIDTPLLPYWGEASGDIRLKAECLQPLGSFKIRCAANALAMADAGSLRRGVATASAGNFAQGLALAAKRRDIALTVHVPDSAPANKITAITRLGAAIVRHPFARWWEIMSTRDTGADDGLFIHPVCERSVILGNATIGLELARQWPGVDTVVVPIGGGGLASGIALAFRALGREVSIIGCEVDSFAPLDAALAAGQPVSIERTQSFVDGIGSLRVLEPMWPLLRTLIDEVVTVSVDDCATAVRSLAFNNHIVVEGAGACALAAALSPRLHGKNVAAVISGGNIDRDVLLELL